MYDLVHRSASFCDGMASLVLFTGGVLGVLAQTHRWVWSIVYVYLCGSKAGR